MGTSYDEYLKTIKEKGQKLPSGGGGGGPQEPKGPKNSKAALYFIYLAVALVGIAYLIEQQNSYDSYVGADDAPLTKAAQPAPKSEKPIFKKTKQPALDQPLDIETAYKLTRVPRVQFNRYQSRLYTEDKEYLHALFAITDQVVAIRVRNYQLLTYHKPLLPPSRYDRPLADLSTLDVPEKAQKAHALIVTAVREQREYFKFLEESRGAFNVHNPLVQSSHTKLLQAWQLLLKAYPNEEANNKYAFEKHLCALDFI